MAVKPIDPLVIVAGRFGLALEMVAALIPRTYGDESLDYFVTVACRESWSTNYRLLVEFLVCKPPGNCASAASFVPEWDRRGTESRRQLAQEFGWPSEFVSHIGIAKANAPTELLSADLLRTKTRLLFDIVEDYLREMQAASPDRHAIIYGDFVGAVSLLDANVQ